MREWIIFNESISTFPHRSKRMVSLRIRPISHNQRRLLAFPELIKENCFLFKDGSNLRKASLVGLREFAYRMMSHTHKNHTERSLFDQARNPSCNDLQTDLLESRPAGSLRQRFWRSWEVWQDGLRTRCGASLFSIVFPLYLLSNYLTMWMRAMHNKGNSNNIYAATHIEVIVHGKNVYLFSMLRVFLEPLLNRVK